MGRLDVKTVLVIGSGPIIIGQAAEFDYSGSQALRALREEGVRSILVNSNPATIMTDEDIADVVYIEPLNVDVLHRIIARERPDGLLPTLGGQTGLNLAVQLAEAGILERYSVRLLGTPLEAIRKAEDRQLFKEFLISIGEPVVESTIAYSVEDALEFAKKVPLPLIIRPAYTLGGTGGGIAMTEDDLVRLVQRGINASPIGQVLVERSLLGWKELEYEVMRDSNDTCITVCNMENIDPMGVHTGDSIVVAPSQTLSDRDYQMLRSAALKIIRGLGIEGGCNIQFALDPKSSQYYVIEVNPRVSRSSALASKATGYPIARMSAKIALGRTLDELVNPVTGQTKASFEPALDYCVVKIPRWPFDKFSRADRTLSSQMKATGEVMAIDRSFEAALQKAVRGLEAEQRDLRWEHPVWADPAALEEAIRWPNDLRLWAITAALRRGWEPEQISELSGIDPWFTRALRRIVTLERRLAQEPLAETLLWEAKRAGFADQTIAALSGRSIADVRTLRDRYDLHPVYKMVDTCAAEFAAATPYYYSTYEMEDEAPPLEGPKAVVIGSGPIRIGQGIEFDYCSVKSAQALHRRGVAAIMINNNPETVSTDFDASDRLYIEVLDEESVIEVLRHEREANAAYPPVVLQFGGQTAINLAQPLDTHGVPILGSSAETIDIAEDRRRFERFLAELGIPEPPGAGVTSLEEALAVAERIGYPVLVRPSYVLGGRAMEVVYTAEMLERYLQETAAFASGRPVLIDKYLEGKELEVDAICDGETVLIPGIMEHIERAGVHSGDSFAVYPALSLDPQTVNTLVTYTTRIALALGAIGLINIQFVYHHGQVYVLEVNPRASRTVPFLSKVTGVPMVEVATRIMLGESLRDQEYVGGLWPRQPLVAVKAPVFSMAKLPGAEVSLGPEMKSTGEAMGVDRTFAAALYKAMLAAGLSLQPHCGVLVSLADRDKPVGIELVTELVRMGHPIYATAGTAASLQQAGLPVVQVAKRISEGSPNVLDIILDGTVRAVINTPGPNDRMVRDGFQIRRAAVERGIPCITSIDTARALIQATLAGGAAFSVLPLPEYRQRTTAGIAVTEEEPVYGM
jgi:carbamoyl-phosphate synthase large subunit